MDMQFVAKMRGVKKADRSLSNNGKALYWMSGRKADKITGFVTTERHISGLDLSTFYADTNNNKKLDTGDEKLLYGNELPQYFSFFPGGPNEIIGGFISTRNNKYFKRGKITLKRQENDRSYRDSASLIFEGPFGKFDVTATLDLYDVSNYSDVVDVLSSI